MVTQNRYIKFPDVGEGNPIDLPSLYIKLTPSSIDATATNENDDVAEWIDEKNGYDATSSTNQPQLHLESGERQVDFVAANNDFLSIPHANTNFIPTTDEFTIIVKIGHSIDAATVYQTLLGKSQLNLTASAQFSILTTSGTMRAYVGGTAIYNNSLDPVAGEVLALVVRTNGADFYRDSVKVADNVSIGSNTTTNDLIIGATYQGASSNLNGSLSHILIYDSELTPTELTNIYNEIK